MCTKSPGTREGDEMTENYLNMSKQQADTYDMTVSLSSRYHVEPTCRSANELLYFLDCSEANLMSARVTINSDASTFLHMLRF